MRQSLALQGPMTYMSIRELWQKRIQDKELFRLEFLIAGRSEKRTVLLSPELNRLISPPWPDTKMGIRCARLRAEMEDIRGRRTLVVCWAPAGRGRDYHQIGRLEPPEDDLFDIRSVEPHPALRILFHFAERDVLVTHLCSPRLVPVHWLDRVPLLDRRSKAWRKAIAESKANWSVLFPRYSPTLGTQIDDYLSNAVLG